MLIEHINKWKLYIETSAGSIIVGKDIGYVKYMDDLKEAPQLNGDFSALLVVDFYVVPYVANFLFKSAAKKIVEKYSDKLDLQLISNNQAIIVKVNDIDTLTAEKKTKK